MAKDKVITYELVVETKGADGKPIKETLTKEAKSIEEFGIAAQQADEKLKKAPLGSEAFKKAAKASKEATTAFNKAKESTMSFGEKLAAIPGPIGGMIQSVQGLSKALLASPIGWITLALTTLYKAFTSTKKGAETMQKAMAFLNAALDVLRDILLPVTDLLVGLFTEPKKTWDDFYNNTLVPIGNYFKDLYTIVLGNLVKGFNNTLIGINKLRIGFNEFMGDEEEAAELTKRNNELLQENNEITKEQDEARARVAATNQKVINSIKGVINEIITEGNEASRLVGILQSVEDRQRALNVERARQNALISEAKKRATDETLSFEERSKALEEAAAAEQNLLNQEIALAEERLAAKRGLAAQSDSDAATLDELAQLEAGLLNLREQSTNKQKELQDQRKSLRDQEKAAIKAAVDFERALKEQLEEDDRALAQKQLENQKAANLEAIENLKISEAEKNRLRLLAEEEYQQEKQKLQDQFDAEDRAKAISALDTKMALLDITRAEDLAKLKEYLLQKLDLELQNIELTEDERLLLIKQTNDAIDALDQERQDNKMAKFDENAAAAAAAFGAISSQLEEGSKEAKAAAIAEALINTYLGATKAFNSLSAIPVVGPVLGAAAAAAAVAAGLKQVQTIKGVTTPKFARGGLVEGQGGEDTIMAMVSPGESVINSRSTRMFGPLLSALNEAGGGKSFNSSGAFGKPQSVGETTTPVIKTYVVANDVTTEQQLYRQQKSRSII